MSERLSAEELTNISIRLEFSPNDEQFATHVATVDAPRLMGHIAALQTRLDAAEDMADAIYEHDLMGDRWNIPPAVYSTMLTYRATKPEASG